MDQMLAFKVPIEGLHTETGPGVYEVAIGFSEALEQADRAVLFKTGAKEIGARFGIMPSFMAKPHQNMPGCSGHIHQSLSDGKTNLFFDAKSPRKMSKLFESYLAGQVAHMMEFGPMTLPSPISVCPCKYVFGMITVSLPTVTPASIYVDAG